MKIEIGCAVGTIRLSDRQTNLGAETALDDVLAGMVNALLAVTGNEPTKAGNTLGLFGFQPAQCAIADDETEEDE